MHRFFVNSRKSGVGERRLSQAPRSALTAFIAAMGLGLIFAPGVSAFDSDGDGIPNKYDLCKKEPEDKDGFEDNDGCPDPDNDKDGVCDPWVAEKGQSAKYATQCQGSDRCVNVPEDKDGFEDHDGCPDPDNDKDGIPDKKDKCPDQAEDMDGFEDADGCPELDNDKDGVPDATDKCPNDPEDKDGFEDEDGCADLDNDGDGIKDAVDKCPDQAENINGVDDEDGCPDKTMPALNPIETYPLVGFRSSTAEITFESTPGLEKLGKQLMDYPEKVIEIRLFTWYKGNQKDGYLELLKNRSRAIVDFLVKTGAKPDQIKEVDYTIENMEIYKGSDRDFNQEKPMEAHLLN
jgi:hypothetical protein